MNLFLRAFLCIVWEQIYSCVVMHKIHEFGFATYFGLIGKDATQSPMVQE